MFLFLPVALLLLSINYSNNTCFFFITEHLCMSFPSLFHLIFTLHSEFSSIIIFLVKVFWSSCMVKSANSYMLVNSWFLSTYYCDNFTFLNNNLDNETFKYKKCLHLFSIVSTGSRKVLSSYRVVNPHFLNA